jgi:hypothetical protein
VRPIRSQHDVELVEDDYVQLRVLEHVLGRVPGGARGGDVARAVLGLPGEAFAHDLEGYLLRKALEQMTLAGVAPALDELHDA